MSGIAGWVNWQNPAIDWKQTIINKMTGSLYRRGPDQLNLWTGPNIALGYAQLAAMERIIGEQPLHYRDQNEQWTIIFDGTLYNCEELISDLQREGVSLVTGAHSEVVLKAYVRWGADCLEKMNGVYSLAIWHDASKTLFLARDRLGVKPLFYTERNGSFLFGSEIKALLSHPEVRAEVDRDGLAEVLGLAPSRTPGHGLFRGLHELRPGHSLTIKQTGIKLNRYWQVRSKPHRDTLTDTIDKVRFLFIDTVKRQLNHIEGSVAAFLSGGVDSSAISAIAVQQRGADLIDTFSIDYAENERYFSRNAFQPDPDAPWVDRMVQFLSTRHRYLLINPEQLVDQLVEAMLVRDQPGMADIDS